MYQIVNLYLETWLIRVTSDRKVGIMRRGQRASVLNMRIYAAQTLLHAADPLNMLCELTPNLISPSQS